MVMVSQSSLFSPLSSPKGPVGPELPLEPGKAPGVAPKFRGPQMGGQIRRGRIWRFWGAPLFNPEVPKYLFFKGFWDLWTESRAKFNHDGSDPPFAALR